MVDCCHDHAGARGGDARDGRAGLRPYRLASVLLVVLSAFWIAVSVRPEGPVRGRSPPTTESCWPTCGACLASLSAFCRCAGSGAGLGAYDVSQAASEAAEEVRDRYGEPVGDPSDFGGRPAALAQPPLEGRARHVDAGGDLGQCRVTAGRQCPDRRADDLVCVGSGPCSEGSRPRL